MTNKRIRKKHAKQNWLRLQREMADPVAFHRTYGGHPTIGIPSTWWQTKPVWTRVLQKAMEV